MKKKFYTLIILLLAVLCVPGFVLAQAQINTQTDSNSDESEANTPVRARRTESPAPERRSDNPNVVYTLAQNKSFAHWSIGIGGGVSIFDGDIIESGKRVIPSALLDYTITGNIERTFNPIFGFGLGYAFIPYGAEPKNSNWQMKGTAQEFDVYLSVNAANLFYRARPQKWGVFVNVGMGISYYNATMKDKTTGEFRIDMNGQKMDMQDVFAWVWPFALLVEYNLSKDFALGIKAEYRLHDKDNYEGYVGNVRQGNWNDAFEVITLGLRYKPHFGKEYHVRNLSYGEAGGGRDLNRRLAELERAVRNMKRDTCCASNTERIYELEQMLIPKVDSAFVIETVNAAIRANGNDGAVDDRSKKIFNEALRGVNFETNKAVILPTSYTILDKIVIIMKENPKFDLDITGHTDSAGDPKSNLDLSDRRAHAVRSYLMEKGIESYRLNSSGKGQTQPIATNSTAEGKALNRRVEFVVKQNGIVIFRSEEQ